MKRFLLFRLSWVLVASFILLSGAFFAIALTPDPNKLLSGMSAAAEARRPGGDPSQAAQQAMAAYEEARNRNRPLLDRYWDWVTGYATLQWGWSYTYHRPVVSVISSAAPVTLAYTIPAIVFSWFVTVLAGTYTVVRGGLPDTVGRIVTYIGLGLPAVIIAQAIATYGDMGSDSPLRFNPTLDLLSPHNIVALSIPAVILAFSILMTQWRAVRVATLELIDEEFVKALRAEGASTKRLARHVLKNATAPIMAISASEVLMVLFLGMYVVEVILGIPGLGQVTIRAFQRRDIGLILAVVLLPAYVGLLANLFTDLIAGLVDPRISVSDE